MDKKLRGEIESQLDFVLKGDFIKSMKWIEETIPIASREYLILGYVLGVAERFAGDIVIIRKGNMSQEDFEEIKTILKRRLPEILEKINKELGV